jgi:hypothetical protein
MPRPAPLNKVAGTYFNTGLASELQSHSTRIERPNDILPRQEHSYPWRIARR